MKIKYIMFDFIYMCVWNSYDQAVFIYLFIVCNFLDHGVCFSVKMKNKLCFPLKLRTISCHVLLFVFQSFTNLLFSSSQFLWLFLSFFPVNTAVDEC